MMTRLRVNPIGIDWPQAEEAPDEKTSGDLPGRFIEGLSD